MKTFRIGIFPSGITEVTIGEVPPKTVKELFLENGRGVDENMQINSSGRVLTWDTIVNDFPTGTNFIATAPVKGN